jgi:hypothetical protein
MPTLSIPAPTHRAETRTALSTPRDGMGRPARPLARKPNPVSKDYLNSLIRAQTDRAIIDRRRRLIGQHGKHMQRLPAAIPAIDLPEK